jgi:hypothetical protein
MPDRDSLFGFIIGAVTAASLASLWMAFYA